MNSLKHCKLQASLYKKIFEKGGICKMLFIKVLSKYTNKTEKKGVGVREKK